MKNLIERNLSIAVLVKIEAVEQRVAISHLSTRRVTNKKTTIAIIKNEMAIVVMNIKKGLTS